MAPGFSRISCSISWNWLSMTTRSMDAPSDPSRASMRFFSMRARIASESSSRSFTVLISCPPTLRDAEKSEKFRKGYLECSGMHDAEAVEDDIQVADGG